MEEKKPKKLTPQQAIIEMAKYMKGWPVCQQCGEELVAKNGLGMFCIDCSDLPTNNLSKLKELREELKQKWLDSIDDV